MECMNDERDSALSLTRSAALAQVYSKFPVLSQAVLEPDEKDFKEQFQEILPRYKPLVYDGPTRTGKSIRACSLYGRLRTLVVDCESALVPDLA